MVVANLFAALIRAGCNEWRTVKSQSGGKVLDGAGYSDCTRHDSPYFVVTKRKVKCQSIRVRAGLQEQFAEVEITFVSCDLRNVSDASGAGWRWSIFTCSGVHP